MRTEESIKAINNKQVVGVDQFKKGNKAWLELNHNYRTNKY